MRIFILSLIVLSSCSHKPKESLLKLISKDPEAKVRTIPVKSRTEAEKIIQNRHRYLKILFEQSIDPYYGKPKWSESCLIANKTGNIKADEKYISLVSELYLRDQKEGFCPEDKDTTKTNVIMLYCSNSSEIMEFKFFSSLKFDQNKYLLCPN